MSTEQDRFQALIEEARQRARRRRQTHGAVAVGIAAVAAAVVVISRIDTTHGERSGLDAPAGAVASAPTGELVASTHLHVSAGGDLWLYLYDDGRLISLTGTGPWRERRLTPEAVAGVHDELISTGLFDPDRRPPGSQHSGWPLVDIQVRNGDRLVNLSRADHTESWTFELDRVARRLRDLQSWLPATAWTQREATSFVPERYAVCVPSAEVVSQLPTAAAAVLETANVPPWDQMLFSIDPAARQRLMFGDVDRLGLCFDVPADQAHKLAQSLARNVNFPSGIPGYREFETLGGVTIGVSINAILPHGAPECACYG